MRFLKGHVRHIEVGHGCDPWNSVYKTIVPEYESNHWTALILQWRPKIWEQYAPEENDDDCVDCVRNLSGDVRELEPSFVVAGQDGSNVCEQGDGRAPKWVERKGVHRILDVTQDYWNVHQYVKDT